MLTSTIFFCDFKMSPVNTSIYQILDIYFKCIVFRKRLWYNSLSIYTAGFKASLKELWNYLVMVGNTVLFEHLEQKCMQMLTNVYILVIPSDQAYDIDSGTSNSSSNQSSCTGHLKCQKKVSLTSLRLFYPDFFYHLKVHLEGERQSPFWAHLSLDVIFKLCYAKMKLN